jgi:hypothetical protein
MKKLILSLIAAYAVSTAGLAQQNCQAAPETFKVVFGNGILTTHEGASASRDKLAIKLGSNYLGQAIAYDLAYNYSDGAFTDLLQSLD